MYVYLGTSGGSGGSTLSPTWARLSLAVRSNYTSLGRYLHIPQHRFEFYLATLIAVSSTWKCAAPVPESNLEALEESLKR